MGKLGSTTFTDFHDTPLADIVAPGGSVDVNQVWIFNDKYGSSMT
jgi:hypothetical protein